MRWIATRGIEAPPELVFQVVADPMEFQKATGEAGNVEFLTTSHSGVGTKFRASRLVNGKPTAFDQEVTEFVPGERVRMINVTHGTEWDSTFAVRRDRATSVLTLTMDAKSDRLPARILTRLIRGTVQRALEKDMDALKRYCEAMRSRA